MFLNTFSPARGTFVQLRGSKVFSASEIALPFNFSGQKLSFVYPSYSLGAKKTFSASKSARPVFTLFRGIFCAEQKTGYIIYASAALSVAEAFFFKIYSVFVFLNVFSRSAYLSTASGQRKRFLHKNLHEQ